MIMSAPSLRSAQAASAPALKTLPIRRRSSCRIIPATLFFRDLSERNCHRPPGIFHAEAVAEIAEVTLRSIADFEAHAIRDEKRVTGALVHN